MSKLADTLTEAEALWVIERKRWAVSPQCNGGWVIDDSSSNGDAGDADVIEIARTRGSLMDAVKMALRNDEAGTFLQSK